MKSGRDIQMCRITGKCFVDRQCRFGLIFVFGLLSTLLNTPSFAEEMGATGKNWEARVHTLYAHDDNVVLTPTNNSLRPTTLVGTGDSYLKAGGSALYNFRVKENFSVAAEYDVDAELYSELHAYNMVSQMYGITPRFKLNPLMNIDMSYRYIWNINDGDSFSGVHYFGPTFNHMHKDFGFTRVFYTYKIVDNFINNDRDTLQNSAGITHIFFFSNFTRRLGLEYKYVDDNAQSNNFDRKLHIVSAKGRTPLLFKTTLDVEAGLTYRDYAGFTNDNGEKRKDLEQFYSATVRKVLFGKQGIIQKMDSKKTIIDEVAVEAGYRYNFNVTNVDFREYKSNLFTVGLRGGF
jgi:hypothetical protein